MLDPVAEFKRKQRVAAINWILPELDQMLRAIQTIDSDPNDFGLLRVQILIGTIKQELQGYLKTISPDSDMEIEIDWEG